MKSIYKIFLLIFLFNISCNRKISHDKALTYFTVVALQIKEVTAGVKTFSLKVSLLSKQDPSLKNKKISPTYESVKNDYYELIGQLDKRTRILDELSSIKEDFYLKHSAMAYLKDTRDILVNDVFRVINIYKPAASKANRLNEVEKHFFLLRKHFLISDDHVYKKLSEIYKDQYHLTNYELIKYGL